MKYLKEESYLVLPDYNKKFKLHCDASKLGLRAVLFQDHGIILNISMKFNDIERNYSIVEKKYYAIIYSVDKCRNIILGSYVEIFTDNRNCLIKTEVSRRIER